MTAATLTVVATTPAAAAALAAAVYACAGTLLARRPDPANTGRIMADLDDYGWRGRQLVHVYAHRAHEEIEAARVDLAFERVYGPLRDRHPLTPRQPRGIDTISRWWQPAPARAVHDPPPPAVVVGMPTPGVRATPTLTGAAA
jgi:hypothetical protein